VRKVVPRPEVLSTENYSTRTYSMTLSPVIRMCPYHKLCHWIRYAKILQGGIVPHPDDTASN